MNIIDEILNSQDVIILDGALGTQIQKKGYDVNDKLWSAKYLNENPEVIKEVHKEYLESGANCIITSTYQASIEGFLEKGFSKERAIELLKSSVTIAKELRDEYYKKNNHLIKPLVAASIGPYGAYLADGSEYSGNYAISDENLRDFHKNRIEILIDTKPDLFAVETIPSFKEAKIISEIFKELNCQIPVWISFSAKDAEYTNSGDKIINCAKYFDKENICAIGVNCTSVVYISEIIENIKENSSKPIVVYPNSGFKYNPITKTWQKGDSNPKEFAKLAIHWKSLGAKLIGGCCETGPEEISELRLLNRNSILAK